jgi:hypothetical protein
MHQREPQDAVAEELTVQSRKGGAAVELPRRRLADVDADLDGTGGPDGAVGMTE